LSYQPRKRDDSSGLFTLIDNIQSWGPDVSLEKMGDSYRQAIPQGLAMLERPKAEGTLSAVMLALMKASLYHADGNPDQAYQMLEEIRTQIKGQDAVEE